MKTWIKNSVLIVFLIVFSVAVHGEAQAKTQLQMPLGGLTGSYYMTGAPTAKYTNEKSSLISVTPNTSGGGVENIRRVNQGNAQLGMATAFEMYKAWNGLTPFKEKMRNWMVVGIATKVLLNNVVSVAESNIRTVEDLKGKIFAIGAPGSAAAATMLEFLEFTGLAKDITMRKLPHQDYATMLMDGKIDAFNRFGSYPSSSVEQVASQRNIALVDFGTLLTKTGFIEKHPYYQEQVVKGGSYKGENRDITFFGVAGFYITNKSVPENIIYEFTRLAFSAENIKNVTMAFKGHNMNREAPLKGNVGPVHPGALKYWKEIGVPIPMQVLK